MRTWLFIASILAGCGRAPGSDEETTRRLSALLDELSMGESEPQQLWDAYDESVQAWLAAHDDATAAEVRAWVSSLPGAARSSLVVHAPSAETLVFVWTEEVYVSGGRVSVFTRRNGAWKRTDYRDFSE